MKSDIIAVTMKNICKQAAESVSSLVRAIYTTISAAPESDLTMLKTDATAFSIGKF